MQQPSGGFRLIVRRGPQPNQIYELTKDVNTVGRDITNDITINDPEVSRHHARLTRTSDGYTIEDLGSTNGTFVNGQRLTGARQLTPGETIGLGETVTLAYESTAVAGMPPAPAAPPVSEAAPPPQPPPPSQRPPYESPPPQQPAPSPYAPPTPGGQPPSAQPYYTEQPPSPYATYAEEPPGGGIARWLLLGCGCFIVLCVIGAVVGIIVIDQTCAWDQAPLSDILDAFGYTADTTSNACQ